MQAMGVKAMSNPEKGQPGGEKGHNPGGDPKPQQPDVKEVPGATPQMVKYGADYDPRITRVRYGRDSAQDQRDGKEG